MSRLTQRPAPVDLTSIESRYQRFGLSENPFPSSAFVNQESSDRRINGDLFEIEIRKKEYEQIMAHFLRSPQSDPNHLRLGYIIDASYIGRGNGKSAFLVNLHQSINKEYCLDISGGTNKCFAVYVQPEAGGRTKTFPSFVDMIFDAILRSGIIDISLAILRLDALGVAYPQIDLSSEMDDEAQLVSDLNSEEWYRSRNLLCTRVAAAVLSNPYLQCLPQGFPLYQERERLLPEMVTQSSFQEYYARDLRRGPERFAFVFSDLVRFFLAAGFNGAYVLVDDFERVPSFQSAREKTDFALEVRSCLFDGAYESARIGFYDLLLVLHAGVPRLIKEAWDQSGMARRSPLDPTASSQHIIPFEKLSKRHTGPLLKKYLSAYRTDAAMNDELAPFTLGAVNKIGELSEYNAAAILMTAYQLLEKAASTPAQTVIDERFVDECRGDLKLDVDRRAPDIETAASVDLLKKADDGG